METDYSMQKAFGQVIRLEFLHMHKLLKNTGIYPGQPPLIFALHKKDGQSQKELADNLSIKPATMTVMIKRMEKANMVERKPDSKDQRITRVFLTDKGQQAYKSLIEVHKTIEKISFSNFSDEEREEFRRYLVRIKNNLQENNN